MKLYDYSMAPNPRRTRIFLAEKGVELETVQVDMMKQEQLSDDYRKINPRCTIPSLVLDDGTVLTENTAIARYLEETHPDPPLMGRSPIEHALVVEWNAIIEQQGLAAIGETFRNSVPAFEGRGLTGPKDYAQIPELVERGRARAAFFFAELNRHLAGRDYVASGDFTLADITGLVVFDFAKIARVEIPEDLTHLHSWHARVSERPSAAA